MIFKVTAQMNLEQIADLPRRGKRIEKIISRMNKIALHEELFKAPLTWLMDELIEEYNREYAKYKGRKNK